MKQAERFSRGEGDAHALSGEAEQAAARGEVEGAESCDVEGDRLFLRAGGDGAAAAADGAAGDGEFGEEAGDARLPAGLFFASEFGGLAQGGGERGIELAQQRHDAVAKSVAGMGVGRVGAVFAPGLVTRVEEGDDLFAGCGKEWADDLAGGNSGRRHIVL